MNLADYADWHTAYVYLNQRLFEGTLPDVTFTLARKANSLGYAAMNRFADRKGKTSHELAMNPDYFLWRNEVDVLGTLAHEQCHIWQFVHGKPPRGSYHDRQWGTRMEAIGLIPSHTGTPGGKKTGHKMTHYVVKGGPFHVAASDLLASGWRIKRGSLPEGLSGPTKKKDPSKVKFSCPECVQNAWAKEGSSLICGECNVAMEAVA